MPYYDAISNTGYRIIRVSADNIDDAQRKVLDHLNVLNKLGRHFDEWQIRPITDPEQIEMEEARNRHLSNDYDWKAIYENGLRIKEIAKKPVNHGFIIYDAFHSPDLIFVEDLQEELSTYFPVELSNQTGAYSYSPTALDWIEIALVFISTSVATGFLTKIGEDFWDKMKQKTQKAQARSWNYQPSALGFDLLRHPMGVTITLRINTLFIQGNAKAKDYEDLVTCLSTIQQMVTDAEGRQKTGIKDLRGDSKYREYTGVIKGNHLFEYGLWFEYVYDKRRNEWRLWQIANYIQDKSDGFDGFIEV